jgi:hypothetical protein
MLKYIAFSLHPPNDLMTILKSLNEVFDTIYISEKIQMLSHLLFVVSSSEIVTLIFSRIIKINACFFTFGFNFLRSLYQLDGNGIKIRLLLQHCIAGLSGFQQV